jgi:Domain of unknown function (DUF6457)
MNAKDWIAEYAERLGASAPTADEWSAILDLAAEAAHGSERVAAPTACWVAAKSGRTLEEALSVARTVSDDG